MLSHNPSEAKVMVLICWVMGTFELDHYPLKLMLHLQAKQSKFAGKLPEFANPERQVNVRKTRHRADKVQ